MSGYTEYAVIPREIDWEDVHRRILGLSSATVECSADSMAAFESCFTQDELERLRAGETVQKRFCVEPNDWRGIVCGG